MATETSAPSDVELVRFPDLPRALVSPFNAEPCVFTSNLWASSAARTPASSRMRTPSAIPPFRVHYVLVPVRVDGSAAVNKRPYPDHMYVPAPAVAKGGGVIGVALCVLSLMLRVSTGFALIDPFASVIGLIAAATFYSMGHFAQGKINDSKRP